VSGARWAAPLLLAALGACAAPSSLAGVPSGRFGWNLYHLRDLWFRAPSDWHASGASTAGAGLERARRHPTRLAGRPAQTLEGDQGGWHVWAVVACDGGMQYRVFFTAATPASYEALDVWRTLQQDARVGGEA
jgi:hypothetical protein